MFLRKNRGALKAFSFAAHFLCFLCLFSLSFLSIVERSLGVEEQQKSRIQKKENNQKPLRIKEKKISVQSISNQNSKKGALESKSFSCSQESLKNKDCYLNAFHYSIYFSAQKIRLNNGRWRSLLDMPTHGKEVDWHAIRIFQKNRRLFLEFFLWAIKEYGKVQSLFWDVYEIKGVQMSRMLSKIIQKRRKNITEWKTTHYIYDQKVNYGLHALEDGKIQWFVKNKNGIF